MYVYVYVCMDELGDDVVWVPWRSPAVVGMQSLLGDITSSIQIVVRPASFAHPPPRCHLELGPRSRGESGGTTCPTLLV